MTLRKITTAVAALTTAFVVTAGTASADEIKIGVLSDMSGATSVLTGPSSIVAIKMAIADFGGSVNGDKIELLVSDHLGKADVGLGTARQWMDVDSIDMLFSVDHSAVALAISSMALEKDVTFIHGASNTKLTNESCTAVQTQMLMDTYGLAQAITTPLVEAGQKDWFFITVDYAFGHDLEAKGAAAVVAAGGNVIGSAIHSPSATDFSSFLLEAQAKGASTIGLATFGSYQIAIAKQAAEFGLKVGLVPFFLGITDVKSAGIDNLQGVQGAISFYWNQNDKTRAFSKRFEAEYGRPPTFTNAMNYEMILHYLKAVDAIDSTDAQAVTAKMQEMDIEMINGDIATIRKDGRVARPMYVYNVKAPADSKAEWDYFTMGATVAADTLLLPVSESKCALLK